MKSGHIAAVGLDVYENEEEYFFRDGSGTIMHDDVFSRLLSFYNVFVSGHQAYLTSEVCSIFCIKAMETENEYINISFSNAGIKSNSRDNLAKHQCH